MLFFSIPAISTQRIGRKADGGDQIIQTVIFQSGEVQTFAYLFHHLQIIPAVRIRVISQKPGSDVIALSFADNPAGDQIQL